MVESRKRKIGKTARGTTILINLETIGAVRAPAGPVTANDIVLIGDRDQISGKAETKMCITYLFHLCQQMIHDRIGLVPGHQSVINGNAVDPEKVVVMQLAVRAAAASQKSGGRIEKSPEIYCC